MTTVMVNEAVAYQSKHPCSEDCALFLVYALERKHINAKVTRERNGKHVVFIVTFEHQ